MFGLYFGKYLVEKNRISKSQYEDIIRQQKNAHVKLGVIAVSEKLLTKKQAEEINNIQKTMDKRFGDIAIEKGYLLAEEVAYLLNIQGNPYLQFVQVCSDNDILTLDEIEKLLDDYKADYGLSDSDIDALKSGDIDRIVSVFVSKHSTLCNDCISLNIRNMVRFINNNILLKKAYSVNTYKYETLSCQRMFGDHEFFIGIAGNNNDLLEIANPFAKENFSDMNEDAFDSVCEFINCNNGLYASELSQKDIHIDMTPPLFYKNGKLISEGNIHVVPVIINDKQVELLVAVDSLVNVA